jgi:hypothetical protein
MSVGYLYILNNAVYHGLLKIGGTARAPIDRARELSTTGVPSRFALVHSEQVRDWVQAEKAVHQALASHRFSGDREFFEIGVREAILAVSKVAESYRIGKPSRFSSCVDCGGSGVCSACRGNRVIRDKDCSKCNITGICPTCDGGGTAIVRR